MNRLEQIHRLRAISLLIAFLFLSSAPADAMDPVTIGRNELDRLTSEVGYQPHNCWVSRNESGTMLFLSIPVRGRGTLVQVVSQSGTRTNFVEGGAPVVNDDGSPICYWVKGAFKFASGYEIPRTFAGRIGFCPSRDYFFHLESTNSRAVFRTTAPDKPLFQLPKNFWPQDIFVRTNDIYLFGQKDPPGPNQLGPAWGLVYAKSETGFQLEKEIDLSAFSGVADMDPNRGVLIVRGGFEMYQTYGLYNLNTQKYRALGHSLGHDLFLEEGFRTYLESRWK